ncbi:ATP dependent DNA ligase [Coprinopsis marcescibilis]|uniref:ATP dependent DNA ligase n=1 Tax=Coprinopsis marcescibilis TaxID=230819 RepID=A0A5C3KMV9_COPMA|nr:ATP dependent DNA ligase [Coprinopsis marcescibilis]
MADLVLTRNRGVLALVGPRITNIVQETIQSPSNKRHRLPYDPSASYHITLLTKDELRQIPSDKIASLEVDLRYVFPVGLGGNRDSSVIYIVVIWAAGQQLRKQLGLPPKHFHITLSPKDDHDMDKGVKSLFSGQYLTQMIQTDLLIEFYDHSAFTGHIMGDYGAAGGYGETLMSKFPKSHKGFLRLADASLATEDFKRAMLAYAACYERAEEEKLRKYCIKKLIACSEKTEWGCVFQQHEFAQIPFDLGPVLIKPWSNDLQLALSEASTTPKLCLQPRDALYIPRRLQDLEGSGDMEGNVDIRAFYKLPRFFRWLIPFKLAIMSTPRCEEDIVALASSTLGIRRVLTLTEETPLEEKWFKARTSITNTFLPVPNYHPPSIEQMDIVMRLFLDDDNLPLLVHCGGGKGRAGTVAACYIAACGFGSVSHERTQPELSAGDAINILRSLRPGSLETSQQEAFVSKWCSTIWKRQRVLPGLPEEPPPCPMEVEGRIYASRDLFMLVGLPGSGKSWFSKCLVTREPKGWQHISQDDSGSRALCEAEIGRAKGQVLLDRCNMSSEDRKSWIALASNWCTHPVCIWFNYDSDLCTSRAQMRTDHPTLPPGRRVRNAIDQMSKVFERPKLEEGFDAIITIRSFAAAQELVEFLSPPVGVHKFPRTPHLVNLGAATEDDIQLDPRHLKVHGEVVITEKIDGANMGFSLSQDRSRIVVQNRSHYVNSNTHEQFKKLGAWVERHRVELFALLNRDPHFPERYILFGEWVYATHSIPYTHLPDYFLAYDFYDRTEDEFVSVGVLKAMLAETSIFSVPILGRYNSMPGEAELKDMVQQKSKFYDGPVEGVYVKAELGAKASFRSKVVRKDFIAGNEHWTRGNLRVNTLDVKFK